MASAAEAGTVNQAYEVAPDRSDCKLGVSDSFKHTEGSYNINNHNGGKDPPNKSFSKTRTCKVIFAVFIVAAIGGIIAMAVCLTGHCASNTEEEPIDLGPRLLGNITIETPGFSNVYEHPGWSDPKERYSVVLSTFNPVPLTIDSSFIFYHLGKSLENLGSFTPRVLHDNFIWPREPRQTPVEVFGFETITQPDGFIPPGKNRGGIHVMDMRPFPASDPIPHSIVDPWESEKDWFYHRAVWKDMDLDGKIDAVACRSRLNFLAGGFDNELVWFKHPDTNALNRNWNFTVLNEECDTMSLFTTLPSGGQEIEVLLTIGYFTQQLVVHWSESGDGSWARPEDIRFRVIESGLIYFDFELTDLNNDGKRDLLVTNHNSQGTRTGGTMFALEIPNDFKNGVYTRHLLADGFEPRVDGGGAPGNAFSFYPSKRLEEEGGKPWILLSGDDDGRLYYFRPLSESPSNWQYTDKEQGVIVDEGEPQIVGRPSIVDLDGDGYNELFVPSYYSNKTIIMTYAPSP